MLGVAEELALIFFLKFMGDLRQVEDVSYVCVNVTFIVCRYFIVERFKYMQLKQIKKKKINK